MLRFFSAFLMCAPGLALAQGWETFDHDLGAGAAVCPYDDPETETFFCFAIACLESGGAPYLRVAVAGAELVQDRPPLQIVVDGKPQARLFVDLLSGGDMRDYGVPIDASRDTVLIEALKSGSSATLVLGIGTTAIIQEISLRGSHAALDAVPYMCDRRPISLAVEE